MSKVKVRRNRNRNKARRILSVGSSSSLQYSEDWQISVDTMTPDSFDEPMDDTLCPARHTRRSGTWAFSIVCLPREHFTLYFTRCAALTDQRLLPLEATERPNTTHTFIIYNNTFKYGELLYYPALHSAQIVHKSFATQSCLLSLNDVWVESMKSVYF